jgi:quinol monooxygenase YgiN
MIIVTGSVVSNAENRSAIEAEGIAHCRRSRAEPGCIAHNCHYDVEDPARLVFVEKWADGAALLAHFALAESRDFAAKMRSLSTEPTTLEIFAAESLSPADLAHR